MAVVRYLWRRSNRVNMRAIMILIRTYQPLREAFALHPDLLPRGWSVKRLGRVDDGLVYLLVEL